MAVPLTTPPITILMPARNEEKSICIAVKNLLTLDYSELELIVINDGSSDRTLELLRQEFRLRPVKAVYIAEALSAPVRQLYRSGVAPNLLVIDKDSGGSKADAKTLSPAALLALDAYASHLQKWEQTRPKE